MTSNISILIPCYQNELNIADLISEMKVLQKAVGDDCLLEFILVDDGSKDKTLEWLKKFKQEINSAKIIKLSGNFGSYNALLAGLNYATGDACVFLHADMQDPPVHIPAMIALWQKGIKLVIGQRVERQEGAVSRSLSSLYHRLIKKIALPYIPDGGYDLILFDRELRDQIVAMNETNINLVYLISWLRYPYATIPVTRLARKDGASGWTFRNKVKLFVDSIVGFSYLPIRLVSLSALLFALLFLSMTGYLLVCLFTGKALISSFWVLYFTCSCTTALLFAASVIAEYLWRTLESTRKRPPYIVDEVL